MSLEPDNQLSNREPSLADELADLLPGQAAAALTLQNARLILEKLHAYKVQLEQQNTDLEQARASLAAAYEQYHKLYDFAPAGYVTLQADGRMLNTNLTFARLIGQDRQRLIQMPFADLVLKADQILYEAHHLNLTRTGQPQACELRLQRQDAPPLIVHLDSHYPPESDHILTVITDLTAQKDAEAAAVQAQLHADALREITFALSNTLDLDEVLDQVLKLVEAVVPFDAADMMLIRDGVARVVGQRGYADHGQEQILPGLEFPIDQTPILQTIQRTRQPMIIAQVDDHPGWIQALEHQWFASYIGVPIRFQHELLGYLNLVHRTPGFFTPDHAALMMAFAAQAALAIHYARLHEQSRQYAVIEERQRLARDLHDSVTQTLFSSSVLAETLAQHPIQEQARMDDYLRRIASLNRSALAEMRIMLLELRPDALQDVSLQERLRYLCDALQGRITIACKLDYQVEQEPPQEVQTAVYRITQEAFNNITKHAEASRVKVWYRSTARQLELRVSDDGRGFNPKTAAAGLGLTSMQERAAGIGAQLHIVSQPDEGTTISLVWIPGRTPHRRTYLRGAGTAMRDFDT